MTLIIVGHEMQRQPIWLNWPDDDYRELASEPTSMGIFAVADSALTRKERSGDDKDHYFTIMTGLRKIHHISLKVLRPSLSPAGNIQTYRHAAYKAPVMLAFAGNAHAAHHCLNSLTTHLSQLRVSVPEGKEPGLMLRLHCRPDPARNHTMTFGDGVFTEVEIAKILKAKSFAGIAAKIIKNALHSATKYCIDVPAIKRSLAAFVIGLWCPVDKEHFIFEMKPRVKIHGDGRAEIIVEAVEIPVGRVVVLGTAKVVDSLDANSAYKDAIEKNILPSKAMIDLIAGVADHPNEHFTGRPVDFPMVVKRLREFDMKFQEMRSLGAEIEDQPVTGECANV